MVDFLLSILKVFFPSLFSEDEKSDEIKKESSNYAGDKKIMKKEFEINNSKKDDYYKQTNNEIDPFISCFPTSMINAGGTIGLKFPTDKEHTNGYDQPEDGYNWYLENNPECVTFYSKPAYKDYLSNKENHPRELYDVEEFAFNKWIGKNVCKLIYGVTIEKIIEVIKNGGAVVTSGKFCGFGHVITIIGLKYVAETEGDISESTVNNFIVDDSYGDPHTSYKPCGVGGDDVVWSKKEFLAAINKGSSDKPIYTAIIFEKV